MTRVLYTKIESGERLVATDITDLTFFPVGTILIFSTTAWNATSTTFKTIWKICDGTNGTPNLANKFLRGATSSGTEYSNPTTTNTQTISVPVPQHYHSITDPGHTHSIPNVSSYFGSGGNLLNRYDDSTYPKKDISSSTTGITQTDNAGTANASITVNIMPSYFTVIYIMKVS
jgi:hypothetical protein